MIRNRFQELCSHLKKKKTLLKFRDEQFGTEVESLSITDGGHNETTEGSHFANLRYQGVIYIERLPESSLALLAILTKAWLDNNDDVRDIYKLKPPTTEVISLGDHCLMVVIDIDFVDPVYLVEDPDGNIEINGKTYADTDFEYWIAESGEVHGGAINEGAGDGGEVDV